jgi:hypothetical protein
MTDFVDSEERLERLLARAEIEIRRAVVRAARSAREGLDLREVERLVALGREEEIADRFGDAAVLVVSAYQAAYLAVLRDTAEEVARQMGELPALDHSVDELARELREESDRILSGLSVAQREAVRAALSSSGATAPLERVALLVVLSVGLTAPQVESLSRFAGVLDRPLEGEVERRPPTARMLESQAASLLLARASSLALAEGQAAINGGLREALRQAVDAGLIEAESVTRRWRTRRDSKVRGHHRAMEGQEREGDEPFVSGLGNQLRFPGDPLAPGEDRFGCRCRVVTRASAPATEGVA